MTRHQLLLLLSSIAVVDIAMAAGNDYADRLDLTLKVGGFAGSIHQPAETEDDEDRNFSYGGGVFSCGYNKSYLPSVTIVVQGSLVIDKDEQQVSRQGFDAGVAYHFIGGSRVIQERQEYGDITWRNRYNFSGIVVGGLHHYAASKKDERAINVSGSVFEVKLGLQYRYDIGASDAVGIEGLATTFTLPASVDRLKPTGLELGVFWRLLI